LTQPTEQQAIWPFLRELRQGVKENVKAMKPKALRLLLLEAIYALDVIEQRIKEQAAKNEESQ
jgi:hypothetical protein